MLIKCGDIKTNPGPDNSDDNNLSICHLNLNGIATNDFFKIYPLEAHNAMHEFDIICISETLLNSEIPTDDPKLILQGYVIIRPDHPSNTKHGGVCIFIRNTSHL